MSTTLGNRSQPIVIQSSPTVREVFEEVEVGFPDDVSSMECPIRASSHLLDDEASTHHLRHENSAPTTGQISVNAQLESETLPHQEAYRASTPTNDTDPEESDLEESDVEESNVEESDVEEFDVESNALELMFKSRALVSMSRQNKRKHEEIHKADAETHRRYVRAAEEQASQLLNEKNAMLANLVLAKAEIDTLRLWKSRHIAKEERLESQLKQLQEKYYSEQCSICCDRVADVKTKCGHIFCMACLNGWHEEQMALTGIHTCAYCRGYLGDHESEVKHLARPIKKARRNANSVLALYDNLGLW